MVLEQVERLGQGTWHGSLRPQHGGRVRTKACCGVSKGSGWWDEDRQGGLGGRGRAMQDPGLLGMVVEGSLRALLFGSEIGTSTGMTKQEARPPFWPTL